MFQHMVPWVRVHLGDEGKEKNGKCWGKDNTIACVVGPVHLLG